MQFAGSHGGKSTDLICRMGSIGVTLSECGVAVLTWLWRSGGIGGKGWHVACFDGVLTGWIVRVFVGVHLSSVGLVNLCSRLVGEHGDLGLDKVGREWLC